MKNHGSLSYFLGIEVTKSTNGLYLSQAKYVLDVLIKCSMDSCKSNLTPIPLKNSKITECNSIDLIILNCLDLLLALFRSSRSLVWRLLMPLVLFVKPCTNLQKVIFLQLKESSGTFKERKLMACFYKNLLLLYLPLVKSIGFLTNIGSQSRGKLFFLA